MAPFRPQRRKADDEAYVSKREIHLVEGACSCVLEDPAQGSLRLDAVSLSTELASLGESPPLTVDAYVDVKLEFTRGPRSRLFAQIVTREKIDGDAERPEYVLRWIHSDPLAETRLGSIIDKFIETGGQFDHENDKLEDQPSSSPAAPPKDDTAGVVLVLDQQSPTPLSAAVAASEASRRSFKFSHLVQGTESPRKSPRPHPEQSIHPPPRGSHAPDNGPDDNDMSTLLRERAKVVRASDLAARHDHVRVLGESSLRQLLNEAVNEAMERVENSLGEAERKQLLEEAEESFQERLEAFKAEKADLESKATVLTDQLEKAQSLLEAERQRVVSADQFTVSDAGMLEIETRLERILHRAVRHEGVDTELEEEMRGALSRLLDEERDRISAKAQETQSSNIELLERKVHRLARSLDETAKERDSAQMRARALESTGGVGLRNVMTAGLEDDDPAKSKKLGLLKDIFNQNKEMRAHLTRSKDDRQATESSAARPEVVGESMSEDTVIIPSSVACQLPDV